MTTRRRLLMCLSLLGVLAAMTATAFGATINWGTAIGVPGLENAGLDHVGSISCSSAGNCAAAGWFQKGGSFVVNEKNGVWGTATNVQLGDFTYLREVSCTSAGSCAAGGYYQDGEGELHSHAFVINERHGVWGKPMKVPGMVRLDHGDSSINAISCAKPGFCAAGGTYRDSSGNQQAFLVSERNGVWQKAIKVPGSAARSAGGSNIASISCAAARSCTAVGAARHAFAVEERNGVWAKAVEVRGVAGWFTSVSCSGVGSCGGGGTYVDKHGIVQAFVVNERRGVWHKGIEVPGLGALNLGAKGNPGAQLYSISCATAGSCAASGSYTDASANIQAFVVSEKNGKWRKAIEVRGSAALNAGGHAEAYSVSCAKAGFCGAGGSYVDGSSHPQAFVVSETNGVWRTASEVPGLAALNTADDADVRAVSCPKARSCVAGGSYVGDLHVSQSFVTAP